MLHRVLNESIRVFLTVLFVTPLAVADVEMTLAAFPAEDHDALNEACAMVVEDMDSVVPALCAMLTPTGDQSDLSARYALSAVSAYVTQDGRGEDRKAFAALVGRHLTSSTQPAEVRAFFVRLLAQCGGTESINTLAGLVGDSELGIPAIQALEAIGTDAAGDVLKDVLLQLSGTNQHAAALALGNMHYPSATFQLAQLLGSDDEALRHAAIHALGASGATAAYAPLTVIATRAESPDRVAASKALLLLADEMAANGNTAEAVRICRGIVLARGAADDAGVRREAEYRLQQYRR